MGECLNGRRARRSVQDGQLSKKIALAVKSQIAFSSVHSGECARPTFLEDVQRTSIISFANDQVSFFKRHWLELIDHTAQHGCRKPAEITELIKKALQGPVPARRFYILL